MSNYNPPIQNIGYKGIAKAGKELIKWYSKSKDSNKHIQTIGMLMEKAGTGGALFRNLYRDFLKESMDIIPSDALEQGLHNFVEIAKLWTNVADDFQKAGNTNDMHTLNKACGLLNEISIKEQESMGKLIKLI